MPPTRKQWGTLRYDCTFKVDTYPDFVCSTSVPVVSERLGEDDYAILAHYIRRSVRDYVNERRGYGVGGRTPAHTIENLVLNGKPLNMDLLMPFYKRSVR